MTPFAVVLTHRDLARYVRHIDIRTIPTSKSQLNPNFLRECRQALEICRNIISFKCTVYNSLPPLLLALRGKERLHHLRIHVGLSSDEADKLISLTGLHTLALDYGSWNVMDMLPKWAQATQSNLTLLVLYMCNELNEIVLENVLKTLPRLRGLHVVGCPRVDHICVLGLLSNTPLLENLTFTTSECSKSLPTPPPSLHCLQHLSLLARYSMAPSSAPTILSNVMTYIRSACSPLKSFTLRLPDRKAVVGHTFIEQIVQQHGSCLERISFIDTSIAAESLLTICTSCPRLQKLELPFPAKETTSFFLALVRSNTLQTLVDTNQGMAQPFSLTMEDMRYMMGRATCLNTVVTEERIYRGKRSANKLSISLEPRRQSSTSSYWFMPRDGKLFV